jgi:RNA polymerase sigma-70 factor (ECF subfamily)
MSVVVSLEGVRLIEAQPVPKQQLADLLDRIEKPLCGYLRVVVNDPDVVFDCAQETFLRAYEQLERGRSVNSQWVYKVARNLAVDHIRRRSRLEQNRELLDQTPARQYSPSDRDTRVRQTLDLLPVAERELLYLSIIDRFRTEEIGAMLGIRAGAVRVRLFRARERFRTLYGSTL